MVWGRVKGQERCVNMMIPGLPYFLQENISTEFLTLHATDKIVENFLLSKMSCYTVLGFCCAYIQVILCKKKDQDLLVHNS